MHVSGQLAEKDVAISPADFRVTALRGPVVDFLPTIDEPHQRLFIANPAETFNWYAYLNPYVKPTWIAIVVALLTLPIAVSFIITMGEPQKELL